MSKLSVGIIGAGLSGIALARRIQGIADVTIFEKSRGSGGRMATRRREHGSFDHGAQYFTVRDPAFHNALEPMLEDGVVQTWSEPLHRLSADGQVEQLIDRSPRFVAVPTMTALAKRWAQGLDVRADTQIRKVSGDPRNWMLETDDNQFGPFDWIVSSAPAPQTSALLPFNEHDRKLMASVRMNGCFTLMIRLPQEAQLPFAACQVDNSIISWIAATNSKPDRDAACCIVVHSNNLWADTRMETPPEMVRAQMLETLAILLPELPLDKAIAIDMHRWRYANVEAPLGQAFLLDADRQVAACGDWCLGNRVESAFLSGHRLGEVLVTHCKEQVR